MIAGSDTPAMRIVEMLIAQSIGDIRSATAIQRELAKRLTSEVVPFFRMAWPDEYVLSVYRNAVKNRDLEIVGTLLGDKPTAIADDDWQTLLDDMNISELTKPETETGWFRPKENSEKQELLARRIKLPGSYLEKIPGVYRGTVTIVLKLERDQLWLSSPNYQSELIPVEENRFEALENNFWYSLIFDEDSQQVSGLMSHMDQLLVEFKKTEV
jgi:hypothetical protein